MPSLKAIRLRIASVKNTQKITKAMKLVAAARLRRAQDTMMSARPYSKRLHEVVSDLAARIGAVDDTPPHPMLATREAKVVRVIVVSSDRGLAGGYNSNLARRTERFLVDEKEKYASIEIATVGRKAKEHFKRRKVDLVKDYPGVASDSALARAREIAADCVTDFLDGKIDAVFVVFNEFKSAISQQVEVQQLLPLKFGELPPNEGRNDFEYEPSKQELLATLLPLYVETTLLQIMLEAIASEFGARMSAMDSASKNAREMIGSLTLQFNRARQAAITKELMEIVGGAEALKG